MYFQIVSDFHADSTSYPTMISPHQNSILIVAGDIGRVEDNNYFLCLKWLCSNFVKVILVPGNHEFYSEKKYSYAKIVDMLYEFQIKLSNLTVLINHHIIIGNIMIFGSIFWSYCPHSFFKHIPIYNNDETQIDSGEYNSLHMDALLSLEMAIDYSRRMKYKMIVVTHYAPTFYNTLDVKYRDSKNIRNYMYCSHSDSFLFNEEILHWVYGHTGYNGSYDKLISNQYNKQGYLHRKVIKVDV